MKLLIVIDMQNDFIDVALGTKEAVAILQAVAALDGLDEIELVGLCTGLCHINVVGE